MTKPESICVFGDSTAWGAWDMEKGGWVNRLWFYLPDKEHYCEIYNLSISGGTTETILERFESEAKIRHADGIIFQSGGNDAAIMGRGGKNMVPFEKFEENIEDIITRAKKITENIIFVGFKNADETKTAPVSWDDIYYLNSEIEKYGKAMERICAKHKVLFFDVFGLLRAEDFEDGLHPNASGHEKIFQKIKGFLEEHQWI